MVEAHGDFPVFRFVGLVAGAEVRKIQPIVLGEGQTGQAVGHDLLVARMDVPAFADIDDDCLADLVWASRSSAQLESRGSASSARKSASWTQ